MRPTFEYGACRIGQHLDRQIIDPFPDLFGEVVIRRIAPVLAISRDFPVQANFVSRRSPLHMQEHLAVYPGEGHREFRGELRAGFGRRFSHSASGVKYLEASRDPAAASSAVG